MRARLQIRVLYDAPASHCRRVVRVLPRASCQSQDEQLRILPLPSHQKEEVDRFGNRVLHLYHTRIERQFLLRFECHLPAFRPPARYDAGPVGSWKMPSRAVSFSPELIESVRPFRCLAPMERAQHLNAFVFESLIYEVQTTDKPLNASQIWKQKRGSCADFAHVLLALARAAGLPARYVAGFGPAPGALHAWVELGIDKTWHSFDPTHGREASGPYLMVAVGRDYYDCAPHRGVFHGRDARLELECELQSGT